MIKEFYGPEGGFESSEIWGLKSGVWNNILDGCIEIDRLGIPFKISIIKKVSNGRHTRLWQDRWNDSGDKLKDRFPRLYALEYEKDCVISDRWALQNGEWVGKWDWTRLPSGRTTDDLNSLVNILGSLCLSDSPDKWSWNLDPSGSFSVKQLTQQV